MEGYDGIGVKEIVDWWEERDVKRIQYLLQFTTCLVEIWKSIMEHKEVFMCNIYKRQDNIQGFRENVKRIVGCLKKRL